MFAWLSGHTMVHVKRPFAWGITFAYIIIGSIISAEQHQAMIETIRDTNGVRYLGLWMCKQMAIYRSADIMNRNIDDVNCVIDVLTKYALHIAPPNTQWPMFMVAMRNGIPIRKHSSAMAKFKIYMFVTVCMFEKRNTT